MIKNKNCENEMKDKDTKKSNISNFYAPDEASLILEGGAMRALFEAGVLDAFLEKGLHFKKMTATSAGAMQAICYLAEQKGRSVRINTTYCNDPRYMGFRHLWKEKNYFNFNFMFGELTYELDPIDVEALKNTETLLQVIVTNCLNGEAIYLSNKDYTTDEYMKVIEASSSIPLLSPPVEIGSVPYVDGGVGMPLVPLPHELPFSSEKPVYILTREFSYRKKEIPEAYKMLMNLFWKKKYPDVLEAIYRITQIYNEKAEMLSELEAEGKVFVIRPEEPVTVKRAETNPDKIRHLHGEGYRIGIKRFNELMRWI